MSKNSISTDKGTRILTYLGGKQELLTLRDQRVVYELRLHICNSTKLTSDHPLSVECVAPTVLALAEAIDTQPGVVLRDLPALDFCQGINR